MMLFTRSSRTLSLLLLGAVLAGCETPTSPQITAAPAEPATPVATAPVNVGALDPSNPIEDFGSSSFGEPDIPLGAGYRSVNDPCRIAGESRFTRRFLDDSSDLVACLRGGGAERIIAAGGGVRAVSQTNSYTLFSVPRGAFQRSAAS